MDDYISDKLEMVMLVFKIRKIRLLSSAPRKTLKIFDNIQLFNIIEEKLQSIPQFNEQTQLFYIDAFYQISRIWEVYCRDKDRKIRFLFNQKRFIKDCIIGHFEYYVELFKQPIQIERFDNQELLQRAIQNVIKNIQILKYIYQSKVSKDQIENFIQETIFIKVIKDEIGYYGFCSINSRRIYIESTALQYSIEAIIVESLYYYLLNNKDPLRILSEGQKQLQYGGDLFEPGDYYTKTVQNFNIFFPSPFRMQLVYIEMM